MSLNGLTRSLLIPAVVGLAVFVGLHAFFVLFARGGVTGWWLDSGKSVVVTLVTLFFAALAVLSRSGATWRGAVAMWVGVQVGMAGTLTILANLHDEENNMWFIVLPMGGVLTGGAILLGMVAAVGLTKYRRS